MRIWSTWKTHLKSRRASNNKYLIIESSNCRQIRSVFLTYATWISIVIRTCEGLYYRLEVQALEMGYSMQTEFDIKGAAICV